MTIYIHFSDGSTAKKLHNVDRLQDDLNGKVRVFMQFSDTISQYAGVARVACVDLGAEEESR